MRAVRHGQNQFACEQRRHMAEIKTEVGWQNEEAAYVAAASLIRHARILVLRENPGSSFRVPIPECIRWSLRNGIVAPRRGGTSKLDNGL